ncbi:LysR family transcriptional regulator [Roseateles cellulosilyticus]|uniref:LysR family transcriptional regulator n=1 Tax=Pelomonas cellulosilytica TaxID=2906762 RepID=A0ABS8XV35_9BURK|nr:LysR family transcriptional regulator [Pelomonas sp. P8]MCE4556549.1 LysR family transcriptional regulator [Pelomonas sp. P8]
MLSDDEIQLMEAIRDSGSLSRAAAHLGKAPSTVSYTLRQIEGRFDALLFDRRRYRLQLTTAGALLVREAVRLRDDMQRLTRRVAQVARGWEDRLWIVTDEIIEFSSLLPVIRDFDALESGVRLRVTHEVLGGTWEALAEGRADLVIGATNEPPPLAGLQWREMGTMSWVYAVAPRHPLGKLRGPLTAEQLREHRAIVVADSSHHGDGRAYGHAEGQPTLAVPNMAAKIEAQRAGLGVGWLPEARIASLLARGELVSCETAAPREPNTLYLGWRGGEGRALAWWLHRLDEPRLRSRLLEGLDRFARE